MPRILLLGLAAGFWAAASPAQSLSASKLSAHLINAYTAGSSNIVSGRPQTLKVLGLDSGFPSGMVQAMHDYKTQAPSGKVVVRIYSPRMYSLGDDPTSSAADFWTNVLLRGLSYLAPGDRALIDYLEGPNEGQTPTLGYPDSAPLAASQWFNQFWTNLTPRIVAAGLKPCIGSIAVGNPGGSQAEMQSYLAAFVPALRQAKAAGGAWSYHAYTLQYTTDEAAEYWYSLRYRQFYSYFASAFPDLGSMPLILTEGGVDASGDPGTSGWQARGSAGDYQRWLNWFDQQLQRDSYLLGCTLFENGDPAGWSSFDLEPIASWLGNYLLTPAVPPPHPIGVAASIGNGTVTITWTNVPLNPTSWSVKRATNNSNLYYTLATNITTGVRGTSWVDAGAAGPGPFSYVVTAVNALGESDNSTPVTVVPPVPHAVNCGGGGVGSFLADVYYSGGSAYAIATAIDTTGVSNPAPASVYQSQRYGDVTYNLPYLVPYGAYLVRLHFAEICWTSPGQRVFDLLLNGAHVLNDFDIVQAAGGPYKANIQQFNAVADASGTITLQLVTRVDNASINGIEIIPNPGNGPPTAPTNVAAVVGDAVVSLTWSVPAGAAGFVLKRSTTSGGLYSVIATNLTQAVHRDTSFVPNTRYYYVVSAFNTFGVSPNSSQVDAQPTNGLPDVVVTSVGWTPTGNLFSGVNVVFWATVKNQGSAPTPTSGALPLGVGFSVTGGGTYTWATYSGPLAAGASVTLQANGGSGGNNVWVATPGLHAVTANADDINRFAEGNEDNNQLSVPFTVAVTGYALNSGGGAVGGFSPDAVFAGSANTFSVTNVITTSGASNPAPAAVYETERWGEFAYLLDNLIPGSNYTVRLHFAEISPSVIAPGDRRFNVVLNGLTVLRDFDVMAVAGGKYRAVTCDIKRRADGAGNLLLQFTRGSSNEPKCSGLQVFGSAPIAQAPRLTSCVLSDERAVLTWQCSAGGLYQLQSRDGLATTGWQTLGNPLLASGTTLATADLRALSSRRFYRVLQLN